MNLTTIETRLHELKLHTAANELSEVVSHYKKAVTLDWLGALLEREIDARKEKAIQARIKKAGFPQITSLESFDWRFNPKINQTKIEQLASLQFIQSRQIALFLGPPGTGKTHIALALGTKAAQEGHRVYCATAKTLAKQIQMGKLKNNLDQLFKKILSSHLWIIDDWGMASFSQEIAEEFFDLFDRRKHSCAMILTSNRDVEEWGELFVDPVVANATIDRLFEQAEMLIFEGKSYRLKGKINAKVLDK